MQTIHQFGDSYGATLYCDNENYKVKNFVELSANQLNYKYINKAIGGNSNEMILNKLIKHLDKIKTGDIIFINFSFFSRGSWYDINNHKIKSTNKLYNDIIDLRKYDEDKHNHIIDLIDYYINNSIDYNMRIFKLINSTLEYLKSKNVNIFYIHVDDSEWVDELLSVGTNIKFQNGFGKWLLQNGFHKEEENHYTKGLQPIFANLILNKTNNFTAEDNIIYVDINDIDFNVTLKNLIKQNLI
jgi:hypothetical protein